MKRLILSSVLALLISFSISAQGLQSFMMPDAVIALAEEATCFNTGKNLALADDQPAAYQKGYAEGVLTGQKMALAMAQDDMLRQFSSKELQSNRPFLIYTLMSNFWTEDEEKTRLFGEIAGQQDSMKILSYFEKGVEKGRTDYDANPGKATAREEDLIHSDRFLVANSKKSCAESGRLLFTESNKDEWTEQGRAAGVREGLLQYESIHKRLEDETKKNIDDPKLFTKLFFGDWLKKTERNTEIFYTGRRDGLKAACQDAYVRGYRHGWKDNYRQMIWRKATLPAQKMFEQDVPLSMDYKILMEDLVTFEKSKFEDKNAFFNASKQLYIAVGDHLTTLMSGSLDPTEKKLFRDYVEAHAPGMQESDLELFKYYIGQKNHSFTMPYAQFAFTQTVETFLDVIEVSLCPLVQEGLLYAKANPNYTGEKEDTKLDLCALVKREVLPQLDVNCSKLALSRDLELNLQAINAKAKKVVAMLPAGTREHIQPIEASFSEGDVYFTVNMDILSRVEIGFDTTLNIVLNHDKQQFELSMQETPRQLHILDQTYRITDIKVRNRGVKEEEECLDCPTKFSEKVSEKTLQKIFEEKKGEVSFAQILKEPIKETGLLEPMVVQVLEPFLAAPAGCYSVSLFYGNQRPKKIAEAKCK